MYSINIDLIRIRENTYQCHGFWEGRVAFMLQDILIKSTLEIVLRKNDSLK